ncbi:MAG: hypothetical protein RLZ42_259, partial [Armatimonadota bacterium]
MAIHLGFGALSMVTSPTPSLDIESDKEVIEMQEKPFQPIWGASIPGQIKSDGVETDITKPGEGLVMGKRVARIANVTVP